MFKKIKKLQPARYSIAAFIISGAASLVWFLIRVIPKPSRASYPCMKAAAPLASSFVTWLLGMATFAFLLKKAKERLRKSKYFVAAVLIIAGLIAGIITTINNSKKAYAVTVTALESPNSPMGEGKGIFPGRVVWVHDAEATNENCTNVSGDYWWMDKNNDQGVIDAMLSEGLQGISGEDSDSLAWDALFRHFNTTHSYGDAGYNESEKIVIKLNLNNNSGNMIVDATPHVAYSLLKQLINTVGVPQENIGIGDPGRTIHDIYWDKCHSEFPDVKYWGDSDGRTPIEKTIDPDLFYSDGTEESCLPTCYMEAKYIINIPVFKGHHRAGVSLAAKNHFGSLLRDASAFHLHWSLPCGSGDWSFDNIEYGMYRIFVDIMGYENLGGKTLLYIVDGIWGSSNYSSPPIKFRDAPFNNDYPSSLFISQDPVAVESVCFDFLYEQFDPEHYGYGEYGDEAFPHIPAADDYLHQAADPENWPSDFVYDPEDDGSPLTSLGVHEHWNNHTDKQYSGNLGTGNGIELYMPGASTGIEKEKPNIKDYLLYPNYPNPFKNSTKIRYCISRPSEVSLSIYNLQGQLIKSLVGESKNAGTHEVIWDKTGDNGSTATPGTYIYKLSVSNNENTLEFSEKMMLVK